MTFKRIGDWRILLTALTVIGLSSGDARAEFPEERITINVGFGAGGGVDAISRVVARVIDEELGQPTVVVNQPGAGGALVMTRLMAESADGYTLASTISSVVTFDPYTGLVSFDVDDFDYLAAYGTFPEAFFANPSRGWSDMADMIAEVKASGEELTYASGTAIDRVIMAAIGRQEGFKANPVPIDGGAEAVAQVLGDHLDFGFSSGSYYPQAAAGNLQVLAALGENRIEGLEDAPTLKELGFDISSVSLVLFAAPSGLPQDVREKLVTAFAKAGTDEDLLALLKKRNMGSFVVTGDELEQAIKEQSVRFKKLYEASQD